MLMCDTEGRPLAMVVQSYDSEEGATSAIGALRASAFDREQIGVLALDGRKGARLAQALAAVPITEVQRGMMVGLVLGAVAGGLVGVAAMVLPGLTPLVGVALIAACTLVGALIGTVAGAAVGAYSTVGVPEHQIVRFGAQYVAGKIFVVVDAGERRDEAERLLRRTTLLAAAHAFVSPPRG